MEAYQLSLPAELTIAQVDEYKATLLDEIVDKNQLIIGDSELIKIDTIGVQFLLSFLNTLISSDISYQWDSQSQVLQESIKQLGLNKTDFKSIFSN